jgi:hypothetical protein
MPTVPPDGMLQKYPFRQVVSCVHVFAQTVCSWKPAHALVPGQPSEGHAIVQ